MLSVRLEGKLLQKVRQSALCAALAHGRMRARRHLVRMYLQGMSVSPPQLRSHALQEGMVSEDWQVVKIVMLVDFKTTLEVKAACFVQKVMTRYSQDLLHALNALLEDLV